MDAPAGVPAGSGVGRMILRWVNAPAAASEESSRFTYNTATAPAVAARVSGGVRVKAPRPRPRRRDMAAESAITASAPKWLGTESQLGGVVAPRPKRASAAGPP